MNAYSGTSQIMQQRRKHKTLAAVFSNPLLISAITHIMIIIKAMLTFLKILLLEE